jgi:hypothetical protein
MSAEGLGFLQALLDEGPLSGVARCVDRVLGDGTCIPSSACWGLSSHSDSGRAALLAREERIGDGGRSSKEHKRGVGNHGEVLGLIRIKALD